MEYLVFKSVKSGYAVIVPATSAMVIARHDSTVVYAIGGNGKERMVWEVPSADEIKVANTYAEALKSDLLEVEPPADDAAASGDKAE